ncbi:hypothetical protein H311_02154 [Anncaliia algerae PRA109]|nr:hypothetical protein H311_02154 [Anncaliia algerae PRA109]
MGKYLEEICTSKMKLYIFNQKYCINIKIEKKLILTIANIGQMKDIKEDALLYLQLHGLILRNPKCYMKSIYANSQLPFFLLSNLINRFIRSWLKSNIIFSNHILFIFSYLILLDLK